MVHYHIRQKIYICVSGFSSEKPGMVGRHYHFIFSKIFHIDIAFFFLNIFPPVNFILTDAIFLFYINCQKLFYYIKLFEKKSMSITPNLG